MRNIEAFVQMNSSSDKGSTLIGTARHEGTTNSDEWVGQGWSYLKKTHCTATEGLKGTLHIPV